MFNIITFAIAKSQVSVSFIRSHSVLSREICVSITSTRVFCFWSVVIDSQLIMDSHLWIHGYRFTVRDSRLSTGHAFMTLTDIHISINILYFSCFHYYHNNYVTGWTSAHAWMSRAVHSACRRFPVSANRIAAATLTKTQGLHSPSLSLMSSVISKLKSSSPNTLIIYQSSQG